MVPQIDGDQILRNLERYARVCYKSEEKIGEGTAEKLLASTLARGHESVIEHEKVTVVFICDRGVSHEIVRHRIASYSQESTRYCNYGQDKFGEEITVINPFFFNESLGESLLQKAKYAAWKNACLCSEKEYFTLLKLTNSPQEARSVLPNSLKTEIVVTFNMREWRHFFRLRCAVDAHPQMRQLTIPLLNYFRNNIPVLFDDLDYGDNLDHFSGKHGAENLAEIVIC